MIWIFSRASHHFVKQLTPFCLNLEPLDKKNCKKKIKANKLKEENIFFYKNEKNIFLNILLHYFSEKKKYFIYFLIIVDRNKVSSFEFRALI